MGPFVVFRNNFSVAAVSPPLVANQFDPGAAPGSRVLHPET
jgi:hypothetical protein